MTNEAVDALLGAPAIVLGSLPPDNRDLDLLVDSVEQRRLLDSLAERGWSISRRTAATFAGGSAFSVDVVDLDAWAPSREAAAALRAASTSLPGFDELRAPAAHHQLLVLARRHAEGTTLTDSRRARAAAWSSADWDAAAREAADWHAGDALRALRVAMSSGDVSGPTRRRIRRPHRRRVIALSGLDGAGKSTHAEHLARALRALGYETSIEWTKLARDPVLDAIARPAKRLLASVGRSRPVVTERVDDDVDEHGEVRQHPDGPRPPRSSASRRRERSTVLTYGWSLVVAAANAATHRRTSVPHPRVVLCDRYVLDSTVHLRHRYTAARWFGLQRLVLRAVSPRPVAAFLLDVEPAVARQRKPEQYTTADLTELRRLYHEEARRLGVTVVDANAGELDVAATIARISWMRLRGERVGGRSGRAGRRAGGGARPGSRPTS